MASYSKCHGCNGTGRITTVTTVKDDKGKTHQVKTKIPHSACGGTGKIYLGNI